MLLIKSDSINPFFDRFFCPGLNPTLTSGFQRKMLTWIAKAAISTGTCLQVLKEGGRRKGRKRII
jgi:hypothetical protein